MVHRISHQLEMGGMFNRAKAMIKLPTNRHATTQCLAHSRSSINTLEGKQGWVGGR